MHFVTLARQGLNKLGAIDAVNEIKGAAGERNFVGLQRANEMQRTGRARRPGTKFLRGFLHAIFTEIALLKRVDSGDGGERLRFADGNYFHAIRLAPIVGSDGHDFSF
jgi:hypothetical protein